MKVTAYLTADEMRALLELARRATSTPWHVRHLDDVEAMNLIAISTMADKGTQERWPNFNPGEIVAATLIQAPRYVSIADEKWAENAAYIVAAANALPVLIEELLERRKKAQEG
jgi:hypothetical protein